MPRVVVDEGDEISAPAKTNVLCRSPHIGVYQVELVPAPVMLKDGIIKGNPENKISTTDKT